MKEKIVVGDIHGSMKLLSKVFKYIEDNKIPEENVIFLGDYVDRGYESKQVLERLMSSNCKCLLGNHDKMLLDFIDNGDMLSIYNDSNLRTVSSYFPKYKSLVYNGYDEIYSIEMEGFVRMNETIMAKLKKESTIEWLRTLDYIAEDEEYIYVHAGLDLSLEDPRLTEDIEKVWIRPNAHDKNNTGKEIIVGHTIVDKVTKLSNGYIMIDCGNSHRNTSWIYSTKKGVINCE